MKGNQKQTEAKKHRLTKVPNDEKGRMVWLASLIAKETTVMGGINPNYAKGWTCEDKRRP